MGSWASLTCKNSTRHFPGSHFEENYNHKYSQRSTGISSYSPLLCQNMLKLMSLTFYFQEELEGHQQNQKSNLYLESCFGTVGFLSRYDKCYSSTSCALNKIWEGLKKNQAR